MTRKGYFAIGIFVVIVIGFAFLGAKLLNDLPVIGALIGAILATVISIVATFFSGVQDWLESSAQLNPGEARVLLVGLGRSGKTSIIRQILAQDMPRQEKSTQEFDIYEEVIRLGLQDPDRQRVSIADYKGQKLSQITVHHPVGYFGSRGHRLINAVIFVVDLFPELLSQRGKPLQDNELIRLYEADANNRIADRVTEHMEYITRFTVEQVFSATYSRHNLFAVRLLINKIDLLREITLRGYLSEMSEGALEKYAKNLFAPLSSKIQKACEVNNVNNYSVHLVSAKTGENIQLVFGDIFENFHRRSQ
jgi:GTPase SAR1 family protein